MRAERFGQRPHRAARIDMPLAGEEEAFAEPSGKIRLEHRDARVVDALLMRCTLSETLDLRNVARRRDHKRAFTHDARDARVPPVDRAPPEFDNFARRALALAERREHAAREPRRVAAEIARAFDELNLGAALGERGCGHKSGDASADYSCAHHRRPRGEDREAPSPR